MSAAGFAERVQRIEVLVGELEETADPALRERARELLETVLELHAQGLAQLLEICRAHGQPGATIVAALARDDLVSSLLLLHDQHPATLEERARAAIDRARAELAVEGCAIELLSAGEGLLRVRLERQASGHHAGADELREGVRETILAAAPDATGIEFVGRVAPGEGEADLVQLRVAPAERRAPAAPAAAQAVSAGQAAP